METGTVTVKGQVVIPAKMRQRLGIQQGTKVCFMEKGDEIVIRPLTKAYFEKMAGFLRTGGKMTKTLLEARQQDRLKERGR